MKKLFAVLCGLLLHGVTEAQSSKFVIVYNASSVDGVYVSTVYTTSGVITNTAGPSPLNGLYVGPGQVITNTISTPQFMANSSLADNGSIWFYGGATVGAATAYGLPTVYNGYILEITYGGGAGGWGAIGSAPTATNQSCLTLNNSTSSPQYYSFQSVDSCTGTPSFISGCDKSMSLNGTQGGETGGTEFFALQPGESVDVCHQENDAAGCSHTLNAMLAGPSAYPCGALNLSGPGVSRCVQMCMGDEQPYDGHDLITNGTAVSTVVSAPLLNTNTAFNPINNTNWAGTNGIVFPAGPSNLVPVVETGFAALLAAIESGNADQLVDSAAIVAAIHGITNGVSAGSGSNLNITLTNWPSNYPDTNAIALLSWQSNVAWQASNANYVRTNSYSNAVYSAIYGATNAGYVEGTGIASSWMGAIGSNSAPSDGGGGGGVVSLTVPQFALITGHDGSLSIGTGNLSDDANANMVVIRNVLVWVVLLVTFAAMCKWANQCVSELFVSYSQGGSDLSVAKIPLRILLMGVVASVIGAFPVAIAGYFSTVNTSLSGVSGSYSTMSAWPLWGLMTTIMPVYEIVTAFFSYLTFRFLVCVPLLYVSRTIIMNLRFVTVLGLWPLLQGVTWSMDISNGDIVAEPVQVFYGDTGELVAHDTGGYAPNGAMGNSITVWIQPGQTIHCTGFFVQASFYGDEEGDDLNWTMNGQPVGWEGYSGYSMRPRPMEVGARPDVVIMPPLPDYAIVDTPWTYYTGHIDDYDNIFAWESHATPLHLFMDGFAWALGIGLIMVSLWVIKRGLNPAIEAA